MKVRALGFGFVLVSMLGCFDGRSKSEQAPSPPSAQGHAPQQPDKNPTETIEKMWRDHLRLKSNTAKLNEVVTSEEVSAQLRTFKECFATVDSTLSAQERKKLIEYGSMHDLEREGKCWEVDTDRNSIRGSHVGYIDMDGKLVFIWFASEG